MKILFVSENYPPHIVGGAEISTSLLAGWLAKEHQVSVACLEFGNEGTWTTNGVTVYPIVVRTSVGAKNFFGAMKYAANITVAPIISAVRMLRLIKKFDPDVINFVATLYSFIPIIILVRIFSKKPIFIDCRDYSLVCPMGFKNDEIEDPKRSHHGYRCLLNGYQVDTPLLRLLAMPFAVYESFIFNLYKAALRYTINNFGGIMLIPLSHYVGKQLSLNGFSERKIITIPNIARRVKISHNLAKANIPTFVYGGRVEKEKGVWDLIAAVELLKKDTTRPFIVKIAGAGSAYYGLKAYLEKNPSIPVVLIGKIEPDKVLELYEESTAIIAPSRWPEPFGRFIQESASTGTPVIATAAGGVTEGIEDGVTGRLFEVGNAKQLATAMRDLIEHPEKARAMGRAMTEHRTDYDEDWIGNKRLDLYRGAFKRPLKILHVTSSGYLIGGAPLIVLLLRNEFLKRNFDVRVLSSDKPGEGMFSDYRLKLIPKHSPLKAFHHLFYFRSYFMMRKIVKTFAPDVIHFHNIDAFSPSILFAIGKIPAVMTVHGPEEFTTKLLPWVLLPKDYKNDPFNLSDLTTTGSFRYLYYRFIQGPIYRLGLRRIKAFVVASDYMARIIRGDVPFEKIHTIPYGITLPGYKKLPDNNRILYVGRLEEVKGADFLIRAFAGVAKKIAHAELRIVGDGSARADLERLAADLNLGDRVMFAGWIASGDALVHEYENASVVALPSIWPEAFGLVCIEALAVGRPVVGTNSGGIPELIEDGNTGYIVPIKDPEALDGALIKLLGDRRKLALMSVAASDSVARFNTTRFIDDTEALYDEVLR